MYFLAFLAALIILVGIIASPFLFKILFKIESFKGIGLGICCVSICYPCLMGCFGLFFALVHSHMKSLGYKGYSIPFTFTFSEWFLIPGNSGYKIEYYYFISYCLFDVCAFLLLICFVKRLLKGIESNNQIFLFISGFNFGFSLFFLLSVFTGLGMIGSGEKFDESLGNYAGYNALLLSFEFFVLSYLAQLSGVILLLFQWLRNSKKLCLFIALGTLLGPLVILIISIAVKARFMTDFLTPLTYYAALGLGIFFYLKDDNNGTSQQQNKLLSPS